jgi:cell division protein FtsQ
MDTKELSRRAPARRNPGSAGRRRKPAPQKEHNALEDVVFLPPQPFRRNRFLLRLATIAAVVLAVVLALSVFFKVEHFEVSGAEQYTAWEIQEASGLKEGDNLMTFSRPGAAAKILEKLPYVGNVRIGIRLPNTVLIQITEVQVTYSIKAQDDSWWLISSSGRVVGKAEGEEFQKHTQILGVHLLNPQIGMNGTAHENIKPPVDEEGNTLPVVDTAARRLSLILEITQLLERNGMIGQAASVDVNDVNHLQMWIGDRYQVKLGDGENLAGKIASLKSALAKLDEVNYTSGVLEMEENSEKPTWRYDAFE